MICCILDSSDFKGGNIKYTSKWENFHPYELPAATPQPHLLQRQKASRSSQRLAIGGYQLDGPNLNEKKTNTFGNLQWEFDNLITVVFTFMVKDVDAVSKNITSWRVVSSQLKNLSQNWHVPQIGVVFFWNQSLASWIYYIYIYI